MHDQTLVDEFTRQAASFNASPAMSSAETLQALVDAMPLAHDQSWLDVACGPGLVTRAIAPHVGRVLGVDVTPAMLEMARVEASRAGLANVEIDRGDATRLNLTDASFDGVVSGLAIQYAEHFDDQRNAWTCAAYERLLADVHRLLMPGGSFVFSVNVPRPNWSRLAWAGLKGVWHTSEPHHYLKFLGD